MPRSLKIAVIGDGVVGRTLARHIAQTCDVDLFHAPGKPQPNQASFLEQPDGYRGAKLAFPRFIGSGGSMSAWGGILAAPKDSFLSRMNINFSEAGLMDVLREAFEFEHLYGSDFSEVHYLFKAKPHVAIPGGIRQRVARVVAVNPTAQGPRLQGDDGVELGQYDGVFLATGASAIPRISESRILLVPPAVVYDKVVTIEPRDEPPEPILEIVGGISRFAVPISLPIGPRPSHVSAVFHHILAKTKLMPPLSVGTGYLRHAPDFAHIVLKKLRDHNRPLWFTTYCGSESHPLTLRGNEIKVDFDLIRQFGCKTFMPTLHSDARLSRSFLLPTGIYTEHLGEHLPPIPFNPVTVRLAKLLADFHKFKRAKDLSK